MAPLDIPKHIHSSQVFCDIFIHPFIHSFIQQYRQTEESYTMRNNSVLGSCDQAVRRAGGLVLELRVALIGREGEEEEDSKAVRGLYNLHIQYQKTGHRKV